MHIVTCVICGQDFDKNKEGHRCPHCEFVRLSHPQVYSWVLACMENMRGSIRENIYYHTREQEHKRNDHYSGAPAAK